jgi:hypothetical protein
MLSSHPSRWLELEALVLSRLPQLDEGGMALPRRFHAAHDSRSLGTGTPDGEVHETMLANPILRLHVHAELVGRFVHELADRVEFFERDPKYLRLVDTPKGSYASN